MESIIPFQGFYNSIHSNEIDYAINSITMLDNCEEVASLNYLLNESIDYGHLFSLYSSRYVDYIKEECSLDIKYIELFSPKYYNFQTDRIIIDIELKEVERIFNLVDKDKLNARIKERFTSRSGFISFYDNTLDAWPESLEEWDLNQIGTLLEVYIDSVCNGLTDFEYRFLEDAHDWLYSAISESCKSDNGNGYDRMNKIRDYLNVRSNRNNNK